MAENEKAPTSATTLTGAAETTTCRASFPISDCTTEAAGRQRKASDFLSHGRETAVPLRHLTALLDADERTTRQMIERERRAGAPICSNNRSGYYLPASEEERTACVHSMRHRAKEILQTARAIEKGAGLD